MTPHKQHIVSRLLVTAVLNLAALTLATQAQDTDIRTFQGIRFERPTTPKVYVTLSSPASAITPYTLLLPPETPADGAYLAITSIGGGQYQLWWGGGANSSLEVVSGTGLRRLASWSEGGSVGGTGYYSNNLQGSQISGGGANAGKSTVVGGQANSTSGYQAAIGGGYSNFASATLSAIYGGNDNTTSGFRGATLSGYSNLVSGNTAVLLGGNNSLQSGNQGFIGAGSNNTGSGNMNTIFGGANNTNSANIGTIMGGFGNSTSGNRAVVLGGTNNSVSTNMGVIAGGFSNNAGSNSGFIGGGASNTSTGADHPTMLGGGSNSMNGSYPSIGGGQSHTATTNHSTIGGGQSNNTSGGTHGTTLSGQSNSVTTNHSSVLGGFTNVVSGIAAVIPGGRNLTVSGQNTFAVKAGSTAMSISAQNMAVIGNMDVWLADNENTPATLRMFEQYSSAGSIVGANINYVAFAAPASTYNDYSNSYTLPDRVGAGLTFLSVAASPTNTDGTLAWITIPDYNVVAHNATAAGAFPAGTDNADIIRVTSTGGAAARIMTLRNGVTNGMVITLRFAGGNAIRLRDTDANLDLRGVADFDMDANDTLTLVWDAASTKWIETGRTVH